MKTVDAKGKRCPLPLIMTKKALLEAGPGEDLLVLVDNETSMKNVRHFLEDHQMKVEVRQQGSVYELIVNKTGSMDATVQAEAYCQLPATPGADYAIAFQQNRMGNGDPELSELLIKAFVNTLPEADHRPSKLVFLNSGIFLALNDSPVLEALRKLEAEGVEMLSCGTCLDFYGRKAQLAVGRVSNMYDIIEVLSSSSKVIYP